MKDILNRADAYTSKFPLCMVNLRTNLHQGYVDGAAEQREIDIQRAREIRCQLCAGLCKGNAACGELKEITKYMKGE